MALIKTVIPVLLCAMLLHYTKVSAQDTIYWRPDYKLTWEDFKATPDSSSKYRAISNSGIKYHLSSNQDSFKTTVFCYFIKSKSWIKINNSVILLTHEQGHFDIAELFARKLRKSFAEYKFNHQTVNSDLKKIYTINQLERDSLDSLYDKESNLSQNKTQQLLWNKKIKTELDTLKKYTSL